MGDHHGTETYRCCTEGERKSSNWSHLHTNLLEPILKRLSFADVHRFKAVCSWWCWAAQSYISSNPSYAPWLMLPPKGETGSDIRCLFNLEENRVYPFKDLPEEVGESHCVGSSHGWLFYLDPKARPCLINPFSKSRIQLPSIVKVHGDLDRVDILVKQLHTRRSPTRYLFSLKELRERFIAKAVLSSDPFRSESNNCCRVVVIHSEKSKLAFCRCGGDDPWTDLHGKRDYYKNILFCNDQLYAFSSEYSVEVWDFRESFPARTMDVELSVLEPARSFALSCLYLVESSGHPSASCEVFG
ncbi:hypothetical protein L1049_017524 [Liquidambar formosana]|uniref:KIB1-4 beta-propeller domain-containing protein n=1 Tax=Liquidambar formosana TaxID=63359 RepID=A0AAP0S0Y3_LIQFO